MILPKNRPTAFAVHSGRGADAQICATLSTSASAGYSVDTVRQAARSLSMSAHRAAATSEKRGDIPGTGARAGGVWRRLVGRSTAGFFKPGDPGAGRCGRGWFCIAAYTESVRRWVGHGDSPWRASGDELYDRVRRGAL